MNNIKAESRVLVLAHSLFVWRPDKEDTETKQKNKNFVFWH